MAYTNIDDPSAYFQTVVWTGNSGYDVNVVNDGNSDLQPDFIWAKERTSPGGYDYNHNWVDSSRGVTKTLWCDSTTSEMTAAQSNYDLQSFNTDGFTTGAPEYTNSLGGSAVTDGKVAWQWKCNGGTTASNSDGSLASVVQANTTAGFSIVTWTGVGGARTVGHGLGVAPDVIIVKNRTLVTQWGFWHKDLADTDNNLRINSTSAEIDDALWNDTVPTSSVFSISSAAEVSNNSIAYCFAEKKGYSKFGSYIGNASAEGPFVYTGFKPAFVMTKNISNSGWNWAIMDSKRTPTNANGTYEWIWADLAGAEFTDGDSGINMEIDFVSNGFKIRTARDELNRNGDTFIYMCFAESPFVTSTGIPTTAR